MGAKKVLEVLAIGSVFLSAGFMVFLTAWQNWGASLLWTSFYGKDKSVNSHFCFHCNLSVLIPVVASRVFFLKFLLLLYIYLFCLEMIKEVTLSPFYMICETYHFSPFSPYILFLVSVDTNAEKLFVFA